MRKVRILAAVSALVLMANPVAPGHAAEPTTTTLYFHSAGPVGNVDQQQAGFFGGDGTYMDPSAPTKTEPTIGATVLQGRYPSGSIYGPAWRADAQGTITGDATVTFWANGPATAFDVHLLVDENTTNTTYSPFATKRVTVATPSAQPTEFTASFTGLNKKVDREVFVQITPAVTARTSNVPAGEVNVFYDSVDYPSRVTMTIIPADAPPPSANAYELYAAPDSFSGAHGPNELSIGVNPDTNTAMILMSLSTAAVTWDDTVSPPKAKWDDVSYGPTAAVTMDPYLFTDRATGRTFVQQLVGEASIAAYTDNDGETWTLTNPPTTAPSLSV